MTILLSLSALLAAVLYGVAWGRALRRLFSASAGEGSGAVHGARDGSGALLASAGAACHVIALSTGVLAGPGFRFGFAPALSATFLVGILFLLFERPSVRLDALRVVVMPATGGAVLLPLAFPGVDFAAERAQPLFLPHLVCGTLAYGVLLLAAVHAALMGVAERALRGGGASRSSLGRWLEQLPPLLVLERILFRFIGVGFVLLTLTALSGVIFSEETFGRPLTFDHKTVFTLISWALFAALLVGRRMWGWRGRTALRLTLAGFTLLLLAYVGTRFVLEVILGRG